MSQILLPNELPSKSQRSQLAASRKPSEMPESQRRAFPSSPSHPKVERKWPRAGGPKMMTNHQSRARTFFGRRALAPLPSSLSGPRRPFAFSSLFPPFDCSSPPTIIPSPWVSRNEKTNKSLVQIRATAHGLPTRRSSATSCWPAWDGKLARGLAQKDRACHATSP